ncbi:arylsulfatase I-like isoform X3 [Sinocyclocheilus anshuiensis]|uniref:arylsulfatase I-like isoform X3 n=1 Tax=Sinocyclocheilus anshuiensis TaxID=1608454 RepID=UPI0007B829D4|nr:PREDICTED: arylsulfatase I-like isoform X3 [Sinocyclocheilus anshuiensis]
MTAPSLTALSVMSLLSLGYLSQDWTSPNHPRPHIIFIMTDDQGFNDIGYHNRDIHTPTLDKLAAEGVKLENYYIQPICSPSRSQFITGRYQIHTGLQHSIIRSRQPSCLPFDLRTLPQRLQEAGYATHMVGKWHLGFYKRDCLPTHRGFHTYFGSLTGSVDYYTYKSCDGPGICGRAHAIAVTKGIRLSVSTNWKCVSSEIRRDGFGRRSGDNGGQPLFGGSNWPLRGRKGTYWEGGIRGIGFVHNPLLRRRKRVSQALVHITDWYPTLVGLAGGNVSRMDGLDGYDMWETISNGKESPRLEILHNIDPLYNPAWHGSLKNGYGIWNTAIQAAVRVGDWKLLTGNPGYGEWIPPQMLGNFPESWWNLERHTEAKKSLWLFNVADDLYERYDLAERRPDVVKQLLARLAFYNRTAVPVRYPSEDPRADPRCNGGAWGPWEGDEENWEAFYLRKRKVKRQKRKFCKMKSFF